MATSLPAHALGDVLDWWEEVNDSTLWQDRIFGALAALFGLASAVVFIQLVRTEFRVPEFGWTIQKVFHFLNFLVNGGEDLAFLILCTLVRCDEEVFTSAFSGKLWFLSSALTSLVFIFRWDVQQIKPEIVQHILLDLPGLAFFTTYLCTIGAVLG